MSCLARVEWIFLDAGNTLIGLDYSRVIRVLAEGGFPIEEEALRRAEVPARHELEQVIFKRWQQGNVPRTGWVERNVWSDYWRRVLVLSGASDERAVSLAPAVLRITRDAACWDRVEPGTAGVLEELAARGYRLGVVSNSSGTLARHLQDLDLARHFEFIIDSAEVGVEKPHPRIFELALELAGGATPSRSVYVGDVYTIDILGATGVGMNAILFDPEGLWQPGDLPGSSHDGLLTVRSLLELTALLGR